MSEKNTNIIVAPHPDDEIIGTYEILKKDDPIIIIYDGETDADRREKALKLKEHVKVSHQMFLKTIPTTFFNENHTFYIPDPIYETHPLHRRWGFLGEQLAREKMNVIFYNTIMNAPYIHECINPDDKLDLLNKIYPDQESLWKYDHTYFLFEGYNKWIF